MAVAHRRVRPVARQCAIAALRLPVGQLSEERRHLLVQLRRPGLVAAGARRQRQRLPGQALGISLLQVLQENTPGHAVDHQVVDDQQQALLALRQVDQHGAQQRSTAQVEAALGIVAERRQRLGIRSLALPQLDLRDRRAIVLPPAFGGGLEAQPQGVMVVDHIAQGIDQRLGLQRLPGAEQQ
ncbi:hypothetical protein D3C76_1362800 [compost metagenome]